MSYVEELAARIRDAVPDDLVHAERADELFMLYVLLGLALGPTVDERAVHDRVAASKSLWSTPASATSRVAGAVPARPRQARGDLVSADGLSGQDVDDLLAAGERLGAEVAPGVLVAVGEVGVGNTTVAAALTAGLLGLDPAAVVGLGAGADTDMLDRKIATVTAAVRRAGKRYGDMLSDPRRATAIVSSVAPGGKLYESLPVSDPPWSISTPGRSSPPWSLRRTTDRPRPQRRRSRCLPGLGVAVGLRWLSRLGAAAAGGSTPRR